MGSQSCGAVTNNPNANERSPGGIFFWLMFALGWLVIAVGLWKIFHNIGPDNPRYTFSLAVGLNIFHDAVVPPVACAVGWLISRIAPRRIRAQICWGLFASAIVMLIGYAPFRGFGRHEDNLTILPLNYTTAILTVLGVVWVIVALLIAVPFAREKLRRSSSTPDAGTPS
jgi:hypothetical protein